MLSQVTFRHLSEIPFLRKFRKYQVPTHHLFIDFKAVYNSTDRVQLRKIIDENCFHGKLVRLIRATMCKTVWSFRANTPVRSNLTRDYNRVYNGLSCQRFNIGALQGVIRRGTIYTWSGQFVDEFNYHLCWWLTTTLDESRAYFGLQNKLRSRKIHPRTKCFRPVYL